MITAATSADDILQDPLRGETFRLSNYLQAMGSGARPRASMGYSGNLNYTIAFSSVQVGPPPEDTLSSEPHLRGAIVLLSGLSATTTDAQIKRDCIESIGRPRFIYMHVGDPRTGIFSGTCVVEFSDISSAQRACQTGILSQRVRPVTEEEFLSLATGEWPMLDYGPTQGVFAIGRQTQTAPPTQPVAVPRATPSPMPAWSNPSRPPVSNPWQK